MIRLYFDGSKVPGKAGCGYVVKRNHQTITEGFKSLPNTTSNVAEYAGIIYGLNIAAAQLSRGEELKILGDSQLVINQIKGLYRVKAEHLKPWCALAKQRIEALKQAGHEVTLEWIRRSKNSHADTLASKASKAPSRSGPNLGITEETQGHA